MKTIKSNFTILAKLFIVFTLSLVMISGMVAFCKYQQNLDSTPELSFADALYVTDREMTMLYGPGTEVQQGILDQICTQDGVSELTLTQPCLYRMGLDPGSDGNEWILMMNFSLDHPETARQLRN